MKGKEDWNARFSAAKRPYGEKPNRFFADFLRGRPPGRLLLPAEGDGRNAVYAAFLGWQVNACDYSDAARERALAYAAQAGVVIDYRLADLESYLPEEGGYDLIACIFMHLPAAVRHSFFPRLCRSLAPGGHLILEAFAKEQIAYDSGGPKDINLLYSTEELKNDVATLEILSLSREEVVLDEGALHHGTAQVVRLIATTLPR